MSPWEAGGRNPQKHMNFEQIGTIKSKGAPQDLNLQSTGLEPVAIPDYARDPNNPQRLGGEFGVDKL